MIWRSLTLEEINPRLPQPQTPCRIYAYLHEPSTEFGEGDYYYLEADEYVLLEDKENVDQTKTYYTKATVSVPHVEVITPAVLYSEVLGEKRRGNRRSNRRLSVLLRTEVL